MGMMGMSSVTGRETVMYVDNVCFSGDPLHNPQITSDGQLLIGSSVAPKIRPGFLTSLDGSVTISVGPGTIDLSSPAGSTTYAADFGSAVPDGGVLELKGSHGLLSSGVDNKVEFYIENSIVLGDLTPISPYQPSLKLETGDLTITLGNINFPLINSDASAGVINFDGSRAMWSDGSNWWNGCFAGPSTPIITGLRNTALGCVSGSYVSSGNDNLFAGNESGYLCNTGSNNVALGSKALNNVTTGSNNIAIGFESGSALIGDESSNIFINHPGTPADNNKIVIGAEGSGAGQQNYCQIAGIKDAAVANQKLVVIDSVTSQLGGANFISSDSSITIDVSVPGTIDITTTAPGPVFTWNEISGNTLASASNGYFCLAGLILSLPASPVLGDEIKISALTSSPVIIQANTGQYIRIGSARSSLAGTGVTNDIGDTIVLTYSSSTNTWVGSAGEGTLTLA